MTDVPIISDFAAIAAGLKRLEAAGSGTGAVAAQVCPSCGELGWVFVAMDGRLHFVPCLNCRNPKGLAPPPI
jgi:hypothetical protein